MEASLTAGAVCSRKVETTFRQVVVSEAARQMRQAVRHGQEQEVARRA